jgi:murein L,D-transpeptidase YcbB/YkuD
MPNKHILYLHDTPLKRLFNQNTRAFSAGCVRVKRVLDLAAWLVNDVKGWTPMRIETTVALGASENVRLKKPVPVHFVYVTAWSTGNGIVQFRPDLYGRDDTGVKVAKFDASQIAGSSAIAP